MGAMGCMFAAACGTSPEDDEDIYEPQHRYYEDQGYYQPGKHNYYAAYDPVHSLPRQNTYRSYY